MLIIFIGLRFEVGGDWSNYAAQLEGIRGLTLEEVLMRSDPGYQLTSWISLLLGTDIYGVNLICAAIFSIGLIAFCRSLPRPWLALSVSVPYVVIVLGMGYTRQGVALGCAMLGLISLRDRRSTKFILWIIVGAAFHKTALLLLPIAALANARKRGWTVLWVIVVTSLAYVLLQDAAEEMYDTYVGAEIQSEGALIRLLMNAVPAVILLRYRHRFNFNSAESQLWKLLSGISVLLVGLLFVSPSSTSIDRAALYLLPLQLVVFAHLPDIFGARGNKNQRAVGIILSYYAVVLFVWLNFATHAEYWVPYRFYLTASAI
jgi:hypothetical protein